MTENEQLGNSSKLFGEEMGIFWQYLCKQTFFWNDNRNFHPSSIHTKLLPTRQFRISNWIFVIIFFSQKSLYFDARIKLTGLEKYAGIESSYRKFSVMNSCFILSCNKIWMHFKKIFCRCEMKKKQLFTIFWKVLQ